MFLEKLDKKLMPILKIKIFEDPLQATMSLFNSGLFTEMLDSMKMILMKVN